MVPQPIVETVVPLFFANDAQTKTRQLWLRALLSICLNFKVIKRKKSARIGRMVFGRRDMIEVVENFALPVLIAVGQEDKLTSGTGVIPNAHDCITGSELVVIPGAGHISSLEQPEFI